MVEKTFSQSELHAIADALGDTEDGLTGSEIEHLLETCNMKDNFPTMTKRHRLYNAFAQSQNRKHNRRAILEFIRQALRPELYVRRPDRFEPLRAKVNTALAFVGLEVNAGGKLYAVEKAQTLKEAAHRAKELREDLELRNVHAEIISFCKEELLSENYFHAILEATKSIADRLRKKTGLTVDGGLLADQVLGGEPPMLAINSLQTESEKSEQRGFLNLVKGVFGMFRNPTAHAPKISWAVQKNDAEEVFMILSMIHRRIDGSHMPPRA